MSSNLFGSVWTLSKMSVTFFWWRTGAMLHLQSNLYCFSYSLLYFLNWNNFCASHQLERERDLLNVLKEKRLKKSINAARQNLIFWWNRCYVSEGERRRFTLFNTEIFSEELLELHEAQVEKLKKLHAQYKDIFLKIDHRENLWRRMEDIERKSKNPVRLFGNRGCALLQEEKERTKIVKVIYPFNCFGFEHVTYISIFNRSCPGWKSSCLKCWQIMSANVAKSSWLTVSITALLFGINGPITKPAKKTIRSKWWIFKRLLLHY